MTSVCDLSKSYLAQLFANDRTCRSTKRSLGDFDGGHYPREGSNTGGPVRLLDHQSKGTRVRAKKTFDCLLLGPRDLRTELILQRIVAKFRR